MDQVLPITMLVLAASAAVWDVRFGRVPNMLIVCGAAAAMGEALWTSGLSGFESSVEGLGLGLATFLVPFALRWVGGGDVKLLAALGAFAGWPHTIGLILATAIAGGLLALVRVSWITAVRRPLALSTDSLLDAMPSANESGHGSFRSLPPVPYAVAMAVGAVVTVLASGWLR